MTYIKKIKNITKSIRKYILVKIFLPGIYKYAARKGIQSNKFIFLILRRADMDPSFRVMYRYLKEHYNLDIHCHYLKQDSTHHQLNKLKRMIEFMKDAGTAKYIVSCDSSIYQGCIPVREGQYILNTWHGCGAFKKFGFSTAEKIFGGTYEQMVKYPLHPYYKLVTVSSPEVVWAYQEAIKPKNPECVQALGISRTDIFFDPNFRKAAWEKLYSVVPQARGKKVILYAPTFRGHVKNAQAPDALEIEYMMHELADEYVLLIKQHPHVHPEKRSKIPQISSDFAFDVTDTLTIDDLICTSDLCISDYSSLIFEYSLFDKPMLFFAYDLDNYEDWRGFYYPYEEMTPGPICVNNTDLIQKIKTVDKWFNVEEIRNFRKKFMSACDGHATERIVDAFLENSDTEKHA